MSSKREAWESFWNTAAQIQERIGEAPRISAEEAAAVERAITRSSRGLRQARAGLHEVADVLSRYGCEAEFDEYVRALNRARRGLSQVRLIWRARGWVE